MGQNEPSALMARRKLGHALLIDYDGGGDLTTGAVIIGGGGCLFVVVDVAVNGVFGPPARKINAKEPYYRTGCCDRSELSLSQNVARWRKRECAFAYFRSSLY